MKKSKQNKNLQLQKVSIAKITIENLAKIKGGTRSTALGATNEAEHTCVLF
ncbi:class I lanthipeptide [uncultured Kordia sp.]|uniref:class I lanthipeptide n=1 Tax=uncultured Kordia sp. TaxID=507699 RepID=UPI00263227EF|nr:class I lanthipeptide [uncultured Kordia sp.]